MRMRLRLCNFEVLCLQTNDIESGLSGNAKLDAVGTSALLSVDNAVWYQKFYYMKRKARWYGTGMA